MTAVQHEYVAPLSFAHCYMGLGDFDEALAWVERAYLPGMSEWPYYLAAVLLAILTPIVVYYAVRFWTQEAGERFPDIEKAWNQGLDELRRLMKAEGRDPDTLTVAYKVPAYDVEAGNGGARRPFSGSPAQVLDDISLYARLGVHELIFDFRGDDVARSLEQMERFAATASLGRDVRR